MATAVPYLGVIEGFFGASWSWQERAAYPAFLGAHGYSFYVYAPKDEPFLRKRWNEPFPTERLDHLRGLCASFKAEGLQFGVGLSPYEAYRAYGPEARTALRAKVEVLNSLHVDILCVLFDDMRGDLPNLAETQIRILGDIRDVSTAPRIIFCPTYYSYDPIIERCFGAMPQNYLEDLGKGLDDSIGLFWTGEKVMSSAYPAEHLSEVAERIRRKPFLWDNYPVNDSKRASPFIFLRAFENRGAHLTELLSGHAVNPMKQPWLSQIPLASLALNYSQGSSYDRDLVSMMCINQVCGEELGKLIGEDLALFNDVGGAALSEEQRRHLRARYEPRIENPICREIVTWLNGGYEFDPACLTD
jgi:hyaluronoglucosaminidase